jgi:glucokinase
MALSDHAVGIDLGGSHVMAVMVNLSSGAIIAKARRSISVIDRQSVDLIIKEIADCISSVVLDPKVDDLLKSFDSVIEIDVGIGVPGNVDPITGVTRYMPNFGWLEEVPLRELLHAQLVTRSLPLNFKPIRMRNDGRCAALAEATYGSGKSAEVFSMLTLGTGIGGALVFKGKIFDGSSFDCGDFGHHVIRSGSDAFPCACGKRGCFETHASAQGLVRHFERVTSSSGSAENAAEVLEIMRQGDVRAQTAFNNYLDDLASGLANLVTFYNPSLIALGGGLSQCSELFENIQDLVDEKTLPATRGRVMIVPASLGPDAGAIGAACLRSLEF